MKSENFRSKSALRVFPKIRPWWQEIVISILLLIPGYWFSNEITLVFLPLFLVFIYRLDIFEKISNLPHTLGKRDFIRYILLPLLFVVLAFLNKIFHGNDITHIGDAYASFYFLPLLLFTSFVVFSERVSLLFIVLVCLEVLVACCEYKSGVRSFFIGVDEDVTIQSYFSFYTSRVFGFGSNSPIFAQRCLIGFFVLQSLRIRKYLRVTIYFLLSLGLLLSFNRTVILALFIFILLYLVQLLWRRFYLNAHQLDTHFKALIWLVSLWLLICSTSYFRVSFFRDGEIPAETHKKIPSKNNTSDQRIEKPKIDIGDMRTAQYINFIPQDELDTSKYVVRLFSSEIGGLKLSGREPIWLNYILFIDNHKLFGNGSDKLMLRRWNSETNEWEFVHAHCSYLMILAAHGIVLGLFFLMMYFFWWNFKNAAFIIAILVYSLTQYGFFWAFSLMDIVFLSAVLMKTNNDENGSKEYY